MVPEYGQIDEQSELKSSLAALSQSLFAKSEAREDQISSTEDSSQVKGRAQNQQQKWKVPVAQDQIMNIEMMRENPYLAAQAKHFESPVLIAPPENKWASEQIEEFFEIQAPNKSDVIDIDDDGPGRLEFELPIHEISKRAEEEEIHEELETTNRIGDLSEVMELAEADDQNGS